MSLPENIRQDILAEMGIDSYFPRVLLPGGPPPQPCDWPDAWTRALAGSGGETPAAERRVEQQSEAQAPQEQLGAQPRKPVVSEKTNEIPHEAAPEEARTQPAKKATPDVFRFRLLCIRATEDLAVINAMPHLGPEQLSSKHRTLLENILKAAGLPTSAMEVEQKPFSWPLVQGAHVDNSREASASALNVYLKQKFADWNFRTLLVMGEEVYSHIFADEDDGSSGEQAESVTSAKPEAQPWRHVYTRSLDELLHNPSLKKDAWKAVAGCKA